MRRGTFCLLLSISLGCFVLFPSSGRSLLGQPVTVDLHDDLGIDTNLMLVEDASKLKSRGMKDVVKGDKIEIIPSDDFTFIIKDVRTGEELRNLK